VFWKINAIHAYLTLQLKTLKFVAINLVRIALEIKNLSVLLVDFIYKKLQEIVVATLLVWIVLVS
jgi:hypothetical protein